MKLLRIILLLVILVGAGVCDYQLRVRVHSYLNPDSQCAACTRSLSDPVYSCCDNQTNTGECRGAERCDTFFSYCLRPLGQTGVECPVNDNTAINTALFFPDTDVLLDVGDTVFGSANPFIFFGPVWMGFQFYLEAKDSDEYERGGVQKIDSFAIDLAIEGGQRLEQQVYEGRFEIAEIELSFEVVCTDNHSLPDCTACEPGSSPLCTDRRQAVMRGPSDYRAAVGGVLGTGGIVVVLVVVIVVALIVMYKCLSRKKKHSFTLPGPSHSEPPLGDNPVYAAHEMQTDNMSSPSGTLSISTALTVEESCESEEREFDNPLYEDSVMDGHSMVATTSCPDYATVDESPHETQISETNYEPIANRQVL